MTEKFKDKDFIIRATRAIVEYGVDEFYKVVESYIESQKEHSRSDKMYLRLQSIMTKAYRTQSVSPKTLKELSTETEKLVSQFDYPKKYLALSEASQKLYDELILERNNLNALKENNISNRNKILLYGETGNGKTTFARNIAVDMGIPFYEIKQDQLIDCKIGKTGKNIADIFSQINTDSVLFLDECDSIGLKRGHDQDHAEFGRSQNIFLAEIARLNSNVIFICATNRFIALDPAFIRRFDVRHELPAPSLEDKIKFAKRLSQHHNMQIDSIEELCKANASFSYLEQAIIEIVRNKVLNTIRAKSQ